MSEPRGVRAPDVGDGGSSCTGSVDGSDGRSEAASLDDAFDEIRGIQLGRWRRGDGRTCTAAGCKCDACAAPVCGCRAAPRLSLGIGGNDGELADGASLLLLAVPAPERADATRSEPHCAARISAAVNLREP